MTFTQLQKIIKKNHIPEDVRLLSDSGWEMDATDMEGIYYNEDRHCIVFTQGFPGEIKYNKTNGWIKLN